MVSLGFCPTCHAEGVKREKRPNGNTECRNGHIYPSKDSLSLDDLIKVRGMKENEDRIEIIEAHIEHCSRLANDLIRFMEVTQISDDVISDTTEFSSMTLPAVLGRTLAVQAGPQFLDAIEQHIAKYRKELAKISNTVEPLKVGDKVKVKSAMAGLRHMAGRAYEIQSITDTGNFIINSTLVHRDEVEPA